MALTLITGPIKSAKTLELIAQTMPHKIAGKKVIVVQPKLNVRDKQVSSRAGLELESKKVGSLKDVTENFDVVAVDELHMFDSDSDIAVIKEWVLTDKEVLLAGLDLDYQARIMKPVQAILKLKPDKHVNKKSVCELCQSMNGTHTQILKSDTVVTTGLPEIVPEDGTYEYRTVCRNCYFKTI